jgi:hypothetical protein
MLSNLESASLVVHSFERQARLTVSPDYWWKIEKGVARTFSWRADGTIFALGLWGAGDVVGGPLCQVNPLEIERMGKWENGNFKILLYFLNFLAFSSLSHTRC